MGIKRSPCSPPSPWSMSWTSPLSSSQKYQDGVHRIDGQTALLDGETLHNPCNMTKSKAPIPSTDKMVASGFASVNACNACATHSQPALVDKSYWKGDVASFTASPNCWATVLEANLLTTSPTTMPLMPPSSFRNQNQSS